MNIRICGTGSALPERKITNDDLSQIMDTSDEWISSRTGIKTRHLATEETTTSLAAEAAKKADIIMILINDELQAKLYKESIKPNLEEGNMLMFAHGFNIHFNQIVPPKNVDVTMIAPKAPGHTVRSEYQVGKGTPCLVAVEQDYTGKAQDIALAYSLAIGGARAGVLETTVREKVEVR